MKRHVFMLSDGTGITAEALGNSLITQFENIQFIKATLPYIDSMHKAQQVVDEIDKVYTKYHIKPLIFMTLVNPEIRAHIKKANGCFFDLFSTFIKPMENELNEQSSYTIGRTHGVSNDESYTKRIAAVDYALTHDDGIKTQGYDKADIILIGVSRCGKTPSCLYLALQFGILAANYPFTEEDMLITGLPKTLKPFKKKLFGLTIDAQRLHHIRAERRPNSIYSSEKQCRLEVNHIESLYYQEAIPHLNSTHFSIEEIATKILAFSDIPRRI